jgi:hypothetical protein
VAKLNKGREQRLQLRRIESRLDSLMKTRVRNILLICSLYDYYMIEEDGRLGDLLGNTYTISDAGNIPVITQISNADAALELLGKDTGQGIDLIICMARIGSMDFPEFISSVRSIRSDLPVVVLAHSPEELVRLQEKHWIDETNRVFTWLGCGETVLGIIRLVEDSRNAEHDCAELGAPCLLLVEDDVHFYSRYLYEVMSIIQERTIEILDGFSSFTKRNLRARARTKVLMVTSLEEAEKILETHGDALIGVITDMKFLRNGELDEKAGKILVKKIKKTRPEMPVILQTSESKGEKIASALGVEYISKNSPALMSDLRRCLARSFGFGDLVFKNDDGEISRSVSNIKEMNQLIDKIPAESVYQSLSTGELVRWLKIQTELELACRIQEKLSMNGTPLEVRTRLVDIFRDFNKESRRGYVSNYSRSFHEDQILFSRLGSGSMGGKGRGLAFIDRVLAANFDESRFKKVHVSVPRTLIITTEFFDKFIYQNKLLEFALECDNDLRILRQFLKADLPPTILGDIRDYIRAVRSPIAVRSSSLLEDAMYQPFAGIYATKMLPNNSRSADKRFNELADAIKYVYASTFLRSAKSYITATNHRVEDEKMAVLLQEVVGRNYGNSFYPHFAGVGRSYDFYPTGSAKPEDGVVNVALGLGKSIVDGGVSLRFTPKFPRVLPQFATLKDMMNNSQHSFYAVSMGHSEWSSSLDEDQYLILQDPGVAESDGTLEYLASTYDAANERVLDGITRPGPRVINFAHVLKNKIFPLAPLTDTLLTMGEEAMGCPVEIEFAVTLGEKRPLPAEFSLLQIRPMVVSDSLVKVDLADMEKKELFCWTDTALGNGIIDIIKDIVYVKPDLFDASKTRAIVKEVDRLNRKLSDEGKAYMLIGPGRWGSTDPWLGIPVTWSQISGVKVIMEASQQNMNIDPSQGSHFFQNMTSLGVAYFTVSHVKESNFIDWSWLDSQPALADGELLRHISLESPVKVMIDGRSGSGVMVKP